MTHNEKLEHNRRVWMEIEMLDEQCQRARAEVFNMVGFIADADVLVRYQERVQVPTQRLFSLMQTLHFGDGGTA